MSSRLHTEFYVFAALVFVCAALFQPNISYALSCIEKADSRIAICSGGSCEEGFIVENVYTGNWCDTRPVVQENTYDLS